MENRIGAALIMVNENQHIGQLNKIISDHADMILGRQGIPLRDRKLNIISLVLEGTTDQIGSLTGKIGRLEGMSVKTVLAPEKC